MILQIPLFTLELGWTFVLKTNRHQHIDTNWGAGLRVEIISYTRMVKVYLNKLKI